ncbi:hypothetical protein LCM20_01800 [Halobacillus litoralis]|uniref:hypothetical protein n=1 Tax=Halobacillus litoralis TaxID=45668 RepID=UPI001CD3241F|nr:hypothetical protein [Halobacillus litoralis]MCA0969321.1 hypothetical protein [Halobacillus litoralis]
MKKKVMWSALFFVVLMLSACTDQETEKTETAKADKRNVVSSAELTKREEAILTTLSGGAYVFDYNVDPSFEKAEVWVEKYEEGRLTDDAVMKLGVMPGEKGSIILSATEEGNGHKMRFNLSISSGGTTGSSEGEDIILEEERSLSMVWGTYPGDVRVGEGEVVLSAIGYSDEGNGMSSFATTFYENPEENKSDLADYDIAYVFKTKFE